MDIETIDHSQMHFVFGSNLAGRHGKGAAATAKRYFQAEQGVGEGLTGQTYALPTKDESINTRTIDAVRDSIYRFIDVAGDHQDKQFMVTRIGCGLAGFKDEQIADVFFSRRLPPNIHLPGVWQRLEFPNLPPRVIIAGGRKFDQYELLTQKCDHLLSGLMHSQITIVSGRATGADTLGEQYALDHGVSQPTLWKLARFPANWDRWGKPAGFLRNSAMAWYATHLIAFWDGKSRGTKDMIETGGRELLLTRTVRY